MKEKIYTIPLNDSFDSANGCPFCFLEDKLEQNLVDYTLGPSMMEPDSREKSNQTGFCRLHLHMMLEKNNRLSLALMLSTHIEQLQTRLEKIPTEKPKSGLFGLKKSENPDFIRPLTSGCVICEKMEQEMSRYMKVFQHMWEHEEEFRKKAENRKGLCMRHGAMLLETLSSLSQDQKTHILQMMKHTLSDCQADLKSFIDMFDYRNKTADPSGHKDAVPNAVSALRGSTGNL